MIFVTLGTQKFQLNRLLKLIDEYIEKGIIKDEVFAQIGNSDYIPVNYNYKQFIDKEEFDRCIKDASLIITHSGVGTIITAINLNKPVIVYPRLAKYKEHVDDHQIEIAEAFAKKRYVLACKENDNLSELIEKAYSYRFEKYVSQKEKIIKIVNDFLKSQQ
ncbi:MAG: PssE/Cps14G family polysaccharide biosynthesis glycosyltransferase [Lachnospiraceae bacterium]|nr:glycosyl transferase [Lachnospiraceae bacterium]MEE0959527.1 PssE/Cps14G family polysaccharide biosynthesis glycosyltransferase [Lachnospiraceae bacterium]